MGKRMDMAPPALWPQRRSTGWEVNLARKARPRKSKRAAQGGVGGAEAVPSPEGTNQGGGDSLELVQLAAYGLPQGQSQQEGDRAGGISPRFWAERAQMRTAFNVGKGCRSH